MGLDGVILVDKPKGITSFDVVKVFKHYLGGKKVGHAGTLDPIATGILPICIGKATRLVQFIMEGPKGYKGIMRLGIRTDSYDSEGKVIEEKAVPTNVSQELVSDIAQSFVGVIEQVPPPFSAVKHKGRPLYEFARKGMIIKKEPRKVRIERFDVHLLPEKGLLGFEVVCSKGTYVRSLVDAFGGAIGCGAHLVELRRTICGPFHIEQAHRLNDIEELLKERRTKEILIQGEALFAHIPAVSIDPLTAKALSKGVPFKTEDLLGAFTCEETVLDVDSPYLRMGVERRKGEFETIAIAKWPPPGGSTGRVKLARVLSRFED